MTTTTNRGGAIPPDAPRRGGPAAKGPTATEFMHIGFVAAIVDYAPAPTTDAHPAEAAFRRGRSRAAHGDFAGAIADYDAAIRLDPQSCTTYRARGSSYYHLGHTHDADRDYAMAFALDLAAFAREAIDILADDAQRNPDHYANCAMHLRRNSRDFPTLSRRGLMHLLDGREAEARRDFDQYLLLNPKAKSRLEYLIAEVERRRKPSTR